jgi:hypothetical protein
MKGDSEIFGGEPGVEVAGEFGGAVGAGAAQGFEERGAALGGVEEGAFDAAGDGHNPRVFGFAGDGEGAVVEVDVGPAEGEDFAAAEAGVGGEDGDEVEFGGVRAGAFDEVFDLKRVEEVGDAALAAGDFDAAQGGFVEPAAGDAPAKEGAEAFHVGGDGDAGAAFEAGVAPVHYFLRGDAVEAEGWADGFADGDEGGAVAFPGGEGADGLAVFEVVDEGGLEGGGALLAAGGVDFGLDAGGEVVGVAFVVGGEVAPAAAAGDVEPVHAPFFPILSPYDGGHVETVERTKRNAKCYRRCYQMRRARRVFAMQARAATLWRRGWESNPRNDDARCGGVLSSVFGRGRRFASSCDGASLAMCNRIATGAGGVA